MPLYMAWYDMSVCLSVTSINLQTFQLHHINIKRVQSTVEDDNTSTRCSQVTQHYTYIYLHLYIYICVCECL